jgi:Amt family ammonium transporter
MVNTNTSAAAGTIATLLFTKLLWKKADLTMILNGALAGLVAITAQPVTPEPWLAGVIGFIAGLIVVLSIIGLDKLHIDDPVGAISVHGVVGIFGTLVVPLSDDGASFVIQLAGVGTIFCWVFFSSLIVWAILKLILGIRVTKEQEYIGLDQVDCGVEAYPEFTSKKDG